MKKLIFTVSFTTIGLAFLWMFMSNQAFAKKKLEKPVKNSKIVVEIKQIEPIPLHMDKPRHSYAEEKRSCLRLKTILKQKRSNYSDQDAYYAAVSDSLSERLQRNWTYWYGTDWDFNGITTTPGEGEIACGYFITTTLKDIGFNLPRFKLAQEPASSHITSLTPKTSHRKFSDKSDLIDYGNELADGTILVIGLTSHVGFLIKEQNLLWMVHSNYADEVEVTKELVDTSTAISHSDVFYVGTLFKEKTVLNSWVNNQFLPIVR